MNFDVISMKQRAKGIIVTFKPNPLWSGLMMVIFGIVMMFILGIIGDTNEAIILLYWLFYIVLNILVMTSLKWFCLKITRGEKVAISDVFISFREKQGKVLIIALVKGVCIYIGLAFCFIGAIFPFYWFRFAENIVKDENTMNPIKVMGRSMKLMKGHYMELVKIDLSFIGWWLLYIFTGGIAGIYVFPYTSMVYAEFYDYIKGQYEAFN